MSKLEGKKVLVVGGSSGIGAAAAKALATMSPSLIMSPPRPAAPTRSYRRFRP